MVATKVNIDALIASKTQNGKTIEEVLNELNYPIQAFREMYSFQQILELTTIRQLLESQGLSMPVVLYQ